MNKKIDDMCMDLTFKNATSMMVNRIWNDMYEYLDSQPQWENATLLMFMTPRHEMLLFPDETAPGKFIGVANVVRSERRPPNKKNSVPLFKIYMKLLRDGRYLVLADCNIGVSMLSLPDDKPYHDSREIVQVATSLGLGDGNLICADGLEPTEPPAREEKEVEVKTFSHFLNPDANKGVL
ncbi:uncharacterized protein LOC142981933 [Anticarsia gemmatalis]|uniref:uncharacterized protein LOC142981933 n=1 Tax=Anticarsia gemmatalis TaxID=129554 RepID=UPI003F771A1E